MLDGHDAISPFQALYVYLLSETHRDSQESLRQGASSRTFFAMPRKALDALDQEILRLLVEDGRRSASEVGRMVGLSPAAAKRRLDRLEGDGVIRGYTAILDYELIGSHLEAFTELRFAPGTQVADIDQAVTDVPELIEAFTLAGDPDALIHLRVRDVDHLKSVIDRVRRGTKTGAKILNTKTLIVLGTSRGAAAGRTAER